MEVAYDSLLSRTIKQTNKNLVSYTSKLAKDGQEHPRIVTFVLSHFPYIYEPKLPPTVWVVTTLSSCPFFGH